MATPDNPETGSRAVGCLAALTKETGSLTLNEMQDRLFFEILEDLKREGSMEDEESDYDTVNTSDEEGDDGHDTGSDEAMALSGFTGGRGGGLFTDGASASLVGQEIGPDDSGIGNDLYHDSSHTNNRTCIGGKRKVDKMLNDRNNSNAYTNSGSNVGMLRGSTIGVCNNSDTNMLTNLLTGRYSCGPGAASLTLTEIHDKPICFHNVPLVNNAGDTGNKYDPTGDKRGNVSSVRFSDKLSATLP